MTGEKGDVYDSMLFSNPYIEIFLQEIKTFKEKHKIIDVPFIPRPLYSLMFESENWADAHKLKIPNNRIHPSS